MQDLLAQLLIVLGLVRENPAAVAVVVGFVTPLLISVLQQPNLAKWQRTALSFGASIVLGGLTAYATGMFDDAKSLVTVIVVLYTASETFYQKLWKQVGLTQQIEDKTTLPGAVVKGEVIDQGE